MAKIFYTVCCGMLFFSLTHSAYASQQTTVGWVERVIVNHHEFSLLAKIDSGADNTSINTVNPEHYEKEGRRWVRFTVTNHEGESLVFEKPVVKTTRVKMKDGRRQERDVIEIELCLAHIRKTVKVSLVDRSHFKYQLLVGRSFLRPEFLIDSGKKFMVEPNCEQK